MISPDILLAISIATFVLPTAVGPTIVRIFITDSADIQMLKICLDIGFLTFEIVWNLEFGIWNLMARAIVIDLFPGERRSG